MSKYTFQYTLSITFGSPVKDHHFTLRCFPESDARQQILSCRTRITPEACCTDSRDSFGTQLLLGSISEPHDAFCVSVEGEVLTNLAPSAPQGEVWREHIFRYPTELTQADDALKQLADGISTGETDLETAMTVMETVGRTITYCPGVTNVRTTAAQALALGQGVCQDYVHICLAALRHKGIACRYTVGLIPGEGQSHAWLEVLCDGQWYGLDPTNQTLAADGYIKLSHGRDYRDCTINRGSFLGGFVTGQTVFASVFSVESPDIPVVDSDNI